MTSATSPPLLALIREAIPAHVDPDDEFLVMVSDVEYSQLMRAATRDELGYVVEIDRPFFTYRNFTVVRVPSASPTGHCMVARFDDAVFEASDP